LRAKEKKEAKKGGGVGREKGNEVITGLMTAEDTT